MRPHSPVDLVAEDGGTVTAQWNYRWEEGKQPANCYVFFLRVNRTFVVSATHAMLYKPQVHHIFKAYFLDPEREQDRKTHRERSYLDNYMLAIRCPDQFSQKDIAFFAAIAMEVPFDCMALAKE